MNSSFLSGLEHHIVTIMCAVLLALALLRLSVKEFFELAVEFSKRFFDLTSFCIARLHTCLREFTRFARCVACFYRRFSVGMGRRRRQTIAKAIAQRKRRQSSARKRHKKRTNRKVVVSMIMKAAS
jgi:hypothetical protein